MFGTFEKWTCRALNNYVDSKMPEDQEEKDYARIWEGSRVGLFEMKTKKGAKTQSETWEPLDNLPPTYLDLELRTTAAQNPAQFLFGEALEEPTHNCAEVVELQTKIRPDLKEEELEEGEKWFVDRSARVLEGKRKSGYAIVDDDMRFDPVVEPLKNTPAAKKMVYLVTGGNPVGKGKGRGVCLWRILMVLSLVVCKISGVHPEDQSSTERQSLTDECKQCLQTILKGQEVPKVMANQAKYDYPELAIEKGGQAPKVSKIMALGEGEERSKADKALAKFKDKVKEENIVYQKYCEISQEEWDDYDRWEDD
ncbi:hypothetical protein HGM15179_018410 [Zosterops borbonicus]|uniref:Uncharacterized protein n=1 Tax=Zosterops borbonicus TaxID=364589 RepID=A0A8K1LCA4_9PASS|nr:hypothetical protein HGM15179_018410 [Zosterops borbonicus]